MLCRRARTLFGQDGTAQRLYRLHGVVGMKCLVAGRTVRHGRDHKLRCAVSCPRTGGWAWVLSVVEGRCFSFVFLCVFSDYLCDRAVSSGVVVGYYRSDCIFGRNPKGGPVMRGAQGARCRTSQVKTAMRPRVFCNRFVSLSRTETGKMLTPGTVRHRTAPRGMFFSSAHVYCFGLSLDQRKGGTTMRFDHAFRSLHCFAHVCFPRRCFVHRGHVAIAVPTTLSHFQLIRGGFNPNVQYRGDIGGRKSSLFICALGKMPTAQGRRTTPTSGYLCPRLLMANSFTSIRSVCH